jgi:hypothetical protein
LYVLPQCVSRSGAEEKRVPCHASGRHRLPALPRAGRTHAEAAGRNAPAEVIHRAIVSPHAIPRTALDVCMRCHLEPTSSPLPNVVARFEHGPFDYRPGEALTDYFVFFDRPRNRGRPLRDRARRIPATKSKCFSGAR